MGVQYLPTDLQNQYSDYWHNLIGDASIELSPESLPLSFYGIHPFYLLRQHVRIVDSHYLTLRGPYLLPDSTFMDDEAY